jgi:hypothetical protein
VVPIERSSDLDFGNQDPSPDPTMMVEAARSIRRELMRLGFKQAATG